MGLKLDLSGVKTFLFEKGEKVGMIACVGAAVVLVGYGVMNSMGAQNVPNTSTPYKKALADGVNGVRNNLGRGTELAAAEKFQIPVVKPEPPDQLQWGSLFFTNDRVNNKRINPRALSPLADQEGKHVQMDYIRGGYFAWDINPEFKTATVAKDAKAAPVVPKGPFQIFNQPAGPKGQQVALQPVVAVQPIRAVVVNAVFPLKDQLIEYRKAFRMLSDFDLFTSKDLPKFLGMNIMKAEVTPGKAPEWKVLVRHNFETDQLEVDPALMKMMRQAIFDESQISHAAIQGLVMPLPKLASVVPNPYPYPKVELAGIEPLDENLVGGIPGLERPMGMPGKQPGFNPGMGKAGAEVELDSKVSWKQLPAELQEKFNDGFYVLDPLGIHPDPDEGKAPAAPNAATNYQLPRFPGAGEKVSMYKTMSPFAATRFWERYPPPPAPVVAPGTEVTPGGAPPRPPVPQVDPNAAMVKPYDALVRFIDPGVVPGKTYMYSIQVRLANPNYGKKTEVAFGALADVKELKPAAPVETPTITIPEEYHLYAIDQKPDNPKVVNGSDDKEAKADQVAVQIHRWVGTVKDRDTDNEYSVCDWVIGERMLLHRGDPVGRTVNIEVPVWDKRRASYDLGTSLMNVMFKAPQKKDNKKGGIELMPKDRGPFPGPGGPNKEPGGLEANAAGIPIDFAESAPPSVLADFDGGKRSLPGAFPAVKDESASNLLILRPDGTLIVRNTRVDSEPDSESNTLRKQRIDEWRERVRIFRPNATGGGPAPVTPANPDPFGFRKKGG